MKIDRRVKESFTVIGKEGSTEDGEGFIKRLWDEANARFGEVETLAKRDEEGGLAGIWGVMSDLSRSFRPWEDNFTKGLYLAGIEAKDEAEAPEGWVKWVIPSYEYLYTEEDGPDTFGRVISYMEENGISLAGAAFDFNCPQDGKSYLFFPVRRL